MPQLAQVVVDVPTMQTNQPYTYLVPAPLEKQLQVGMRVAVPFGNGHREVQGFVVGFTEHSSYEGELKPIAAVMDFQPVVNTELLELSKWLADTTYSFWISCLYTMLPNMLKSKSQRFVRVIDEIDEQTCFDLFHGKDECDLAELQSDPEKVKELLKLQREKKVAIEYRVTDRARAKTVTGITPSWISNSWKMPGRRCIPMPTPRIG